MELTEVLLLGDSTCGTIAG